MHVQINQDVLNGVLTAAKDVQQATNARPARVDGLLALKGVLDIVEPDEDQDTRKEVDAALIRGLEAALEEYGRLSEQEDDPDADAAALGARDPETLEEEPAKV